MGGTAQKDRSWSPFSACDCLAVQSSASSAASIRDPGERHRRALDRADWENGVDQRRLDDLTEELFELHDLNGDSQLEEAELIRLNEMIAQVHMGKEADTGAVKSKYQSVFRSKLDPDGKPVRYQAFRNYAREVLDALDSDPEAQEMILEQFVAEARTAREVFDMPLATRRKTLLPAPGRKAPTVRVLHNGCLSIACPMMWDSSRALAAPCFSPGFGGIASKSTCGGSWSQAEARAMDRASMLLHAAGVNSGTKGFGGL